MPALIPLGCAVLLLSISGCSSSGKMGLVNVAPDGKSFVEATSELTFVPFGTNYYDPNTGWPPKVWQKFDEAQVKMHFDLMTGFGVNCARVFLTAATFQPGPQTVDEEALKKLDRLVRIARRAGIRLILTGPDHWEGEPAYWKPDRFAGDEAMKALETFWTVVGTRYKGEPAILAWDLLNEPRMPWAVDSWTPKWHAWLQSKYADRAGLQAAWADELKPDEDFGSIQVPPDTAAKGNPRLHDWQLFREHLADQWVQRQVQVLREVDPTHLITIGYVQLSYPLIRPGEPSLYSAFNPRRQAQWLDFVSIHFYPLMGNPYGSRASWTQNLAYLQSILAYCQAGKPVVLGEYGWYGGGAPEGRPRLGEDQQERWLIAEIEASRRLAQGWLSWPFADTPDADDMSVYGGMVKYNMVPKIWAWCFRAHTNHLAVLPQPMPEMPAFDYVRSLTAPVEDLAVIYDQHSSAVQAALEKAGPTEKIELIAEEEPTDEKEVD